MIGKYRKNREVTKIRMYLNTTNFKTFLFKTQNNLISNTQTKKINKTKTKIRLIPHVLRFRPSIDRTRSFHRTAKRK